MILYVTDGSSENRWQPFYKKSDRGTGFHLTFFPSDMYILPRSWNKRVR